VKHNSRKDLCSAPPLVTSRRSLNSDLSPQLLTHSAWKNGTEMDLEGSSNSSANVASSQRKLRHGKTLFVLFEFRFRGSELATERSGFDPLGLRGHRGCVYNVKKAK
jgi:hypothetical protein